MVPETRVSCRNLTVSWAHVKRVDGKPCDLVTIASSKDFVSGLASVDGEPIDPFYLQAFGGDVPLFRNPLRSEPKSKPEVKSTPLPSVRQSASSLFEQSKAALRARDINHAYQLFMRAYAQSCDDAHAGSESDAGIMRVNDPKGWLAMLHRAGEKIKALSVDTAIRDQLLRVVEPRECRNRTITCSLSAATRKQGCPRQTYAGR